FCWKRWDCAPESTSTVWSRPAQSSWKACRASRCTGTCPTPGCRRDSFSRPKAVASRSSASLPRLSLPAAGRRPRRDVGRLHAGVELPRIAALLAWSVARALAAAERHVIVDAGGGQVDHHHAGLRVALEVRRVRERSGADAGGKSEGRVVGERERLLVAVGW